MGTKDKKKISPAKQDFENLVPYKDIPEIMAEELEGMVLKEEFSRIWPLVAQIENHPAKEENFTADELKGFPENLSRVIEILSVVCGVSPEECAEEGRLTEPQRSFGNKLFAEIQKEAHNKAMKEYLEPWLRLSVEERIESINRNCRGGGIVGIGPNSMLESDLPGID